MTYLIVKKDFGPVPLHFQRAFLEMPHGGDSEYDLWENEKDCRIFNLHLGPPLWPKNIFKGRVIYVHRNAKDVVVSSYHHYKSQIAFPFNQSFEEFVNRFIKGETFWGPFHKHLQDTDEMVKGGKPILLISYEETKKNSKNTIRKIAAFLGESLSDEMVDKIYEATTSENMKHNNDVNGAIWRSAGSWDSKEPFVRQAQVDGWVDSFKDDNLLKTFELYINDKIPKSMQTEIS